MLRGEGSGQFQPLPEECLMELTQESRPSFARHFYALMILKEPLPVHPEVAPERVHVPEITPFFTVPSRVRTFPLGLPDCSVNANDPVTFPSKFPLSTKEAVAVPPETKQGDEVVNERLTTVTSVPLLCRKEVAKVKTGELLVSLNVAVQLPLILPDPEPGLPPPHPPRNAERAITRTIPIRRMGDSSSLYQPELA